MTALTFTIPGPPVPWQRAGSFHGLRFTPAKTRAYQQRVAWAMRAAMPPDWPLDAGYRVEVRAFFADAKRRDADNVLKTVCDAGNKIAWADDSQISDMRVTKAVDKANPRAEVTVTLLAPEPVESKPKARKPRAAKGE